MRSLPLICLLFLPFALLSQSPESLQTLQVAAESAQDTTLISLYLQIARQHLELTPAPDSAEKYADLALSMSEDLESAYWQNRAFLLQSRLAYRLKDWENSDDWLKKALPFAEAEQDQELLATIHTNLGRNAMMRDEWNFALEAFLLALEIEEERPGGSISGLLSNIGLVYGNMEQVAEGLPYLNRAFHLASQAADTLTMLQISNNLAHFYIHEAVGEPASPLLDSASKYAIWLLETSERAQIFQGIIRGKSLVGKTYFLKEKFQLARKYNLEALELIDESQMPGLAETVYLSLAHVYDTLGQSSQAIQTAHRALTLARTSREPIKVLAVYEDLTKFYQRDGQFQEALRYTQLAHKLEDSLFTEEKTREIQRLQTEFETKEKEQAIQNLEQQNHIQALQIRQGIFLILGLVLLGSLLIGGGMLVYRGRVVKEKERAMEARLQALRSQMNPHFLFHALSSIQTYLYEHQDYDGTGRFLAKYAKLMRLILENSREELIPLDQEIRTLTQYLDLQQLRYQHAFSYDLYLDPQLDPETVLLPPMFAQPFIENALEHGRLHEQEHGKLFLRFQLRKGQLEMTVEDNGIGRRQASNHKHGRDHKSLATEIAQDRMELLQKKFRKAVQLSITDRLDESGQEVGTKVMFRMPLVEE